MMAEIDFQTSRRDIVRGVSAIEEAFEGYETARKYYDGDVDEVFATPVVKRAIEQTGSHYKFNMAKTPVTALVDMLEIDAIKTGKPEIDDFLVEYRKRHEMGLKDKALLTELCEYGDTYAMIWPTLDESGEVQDVVPVLNSPFGLRAIYDDDGNLLYFTKMWVEVESNGTKHRRVDLYYKDRIESWIAIDSGGKAEDMEWVEFIGIDGETGEEFSSTSTTPLEDFPLFHYRNAYQYGKPEHFGAYGPQDALTKMLVSQITSTDSHMLASRWGLIKADRALADNNDDPDFDDDLIANDNDMRQGGVSSALRQGPGTLTMFTGVDSVGEFSAADPKVFIDPVSLYVRLMAQITGTPLHYFDPSGTTPSGESLKVAMSPLLNRRKNIQSWAESTLKKMYTHILKLFGYEVETIEILWAGDNDDIFGLSSSEEMQKWQIIEQKRVAGLPFRFCLLEAGYKESEVDAIMAEVANSNPVLPTQQPAAPDNTNMMNNTDMMALDGANKEKVSENV